MENYAAIILAAGKGKRMGDSDSGSDIPKVMYKLVGKPIIRHSVSSIERAGIKEIILVVGYKRELIENYFGDEVIYAVQEEQLGTGHAASCARPILEGKAQSVIIFYGDNPLYKPETIQKLLRLYETEKPTVAMLSVNIDNPNFWVFGRLIRDKSGDVEAVIEQKDCTADQLEIKECNPGFYVFDADWLWKNIDKLRTKNVQKELYLTDMIMIASAQGKRIVAMPVSEESEALGINNQEQLELAVTTLADRAAGRSDSGWVILGA